MQIDSAMRRRLILLLCGALLAPAASAWAGSCNAISPAHTVALLELYTSEGCSSCPPADAFVNGLKSAAAGGRSTAQSVVPIALHVDYWDSPGWVDRFAQPRFTARQRWLSKQAGSHTVYTPEIFIGAREERNWRADAATAIRRINATPAAAHIQLSWSAAAPAGAPIDVQAQAPIGAQLFIAVVENALSSEVRAGENGGVRLHHEHVVREWIGPLSMPQGQVHWHQTIALPSAVQATQLSLVAFVQDTQGAILQALALPSCSS